MNSLLHNLHSLQPRSMFTASKWLSSITHSTTRLLSVTAESGNAKLSIKGTPEYNSIPHNHHQNEFLFMATITAPLIDTQKRGAIDLICVLDESGSMYGAPIDLLKDSMKFIASNLTSNDRFGCVGYNSTDRIISDMNYMSPSIKKDVLRSLDSMNAGDLTALCAGLETGVDMMRNCVLDDLKNDIDTKNRVQNILLLTDGKANVGYVDPKDIIRALSDREFANKGRKNSVASLLDNMKKSISFIDLMSADEKKDADKIYTEIPCSVDSFGFGKHHDANFLTELSEYCRGLYTYIEGTEDIAGTFGEMLGGMLSVVGKDVKIRVKTLSDDVQILKCLSDNAALSLKEIEKNKHYEIQLFNDVQSEENRDLLFQIAIPKIDNVAEQDELWNYIHIECEYFNIISNQMEQISTVCKIQRPKDEIKTEQTRNYAIDVQYNRILSTKAIQSAIEVANKGDLDSAKNVIEKAKKEIAQSVSKDDAYCQSLIKDLNVCIEGMETKTKYEAHGSKRGQTLMQTQYTQRSYQCGDVVNLDMASYSFLKTKAKTLWRKKAEADTQKTPN